MAYCRAVKALTPEVENKVYIGRTDYEQAERGVRVI